MKITAIIKSLEQLFERPLSIGAKRNIIFWYDDDGAFSEEINMGSIELANAKIIKLDANNMFATKLYIERIDRESNLLVYSPSKRPDNLENWLTDTIKYSQVYSTDVVSLIMLNHGIDNALRSVVDKYKSFFKRAERVKRFESYGLAPYSEQKIDIGIHSALCKLPAPNIDNIIRTLLLEMINGENTIYESISNYGNVNALWKLINETYGYTFPEQSLEKLAILLLCSHLSHSLDKNMPQEWNAFVSESPNCFVFVDNLMRNNQYWDDYNRLAAFVAEKLNLSNKSTNWTIDEIVDCDTFEYFDKSIIARINDNILQDAGEYEFYRKIMNSRKNRRYYPQFTTEYNTLDYACEYLNLSVRYRDLTGTDTRQLFENYIKDLYKLDSSYRHFMAAYDHLHENEQFSLLFDKVENSYTNWFLNELSMKWCALWDDETYWNLSGVTSQQEFYNRFVSRYVSNNERIIVIISDGLRYESAVELNSILNREQSGSSQLDVMFGVIPSNTSLGMAAMLPHKQLTVTDKGDYEIEGISTEGTENRGKVLNLVKKESFAIKYKDVEKLSKPQLVEKFTNVKLVYIYHNTIDARGDNASTEHEVFEATEKAFKELSNLVRRLRNDVSAIRIIITADHGYIYRQSPLQEYDKTSKQELIGVKSSRRYILAKENIEKQGTQHFPMSYLTKNNNDMYAILPRSDNCFKLKGSGNRYVHGGTSLQEVVIPIISFKSDKNASRSMSAKKVSLGLTNISRKVTSVITFINFFQNEPVDDKHLPLRVTAYFADEFGNRISNENIIIANSTDTRPEKRVYKEKFTLKNMSYDKGMTYYLILKDEEAVVNTEIERIPFVIDLVFGGSIQF